MPLLDRALTVATIVSIAANIYDAHVRRRWENRADDEKDRRLRALEERIAKIETAREPSPPVA